MAQILDYSAGYPGALHIQRLGYVGVIRYLRKEGTSSVRPLTVAEVADMRAYDRTIALVYQHVSKSRVTEGRVAGRHDAEWALARAHECGIEPRAIYFAVDFDAVPSTVAEYFRGTADMLGIAKVGGYGGYRVLAYLFDQGLIRWGWQTVAWSAGRREGRAHLFQRVGYVYPGGIQCDVNDVLKADYGQHPAPQEEDMTPDEHNVLWELAYRIRSMHYGGYLPVEDAPEYGGDLSWFQSQLAAGIVHLTDDEATIIAATRAAIQEIPAGGEVDVATLAPALIGAINQLGTLVARAPDNQVEQLLAAIGEIPTDVRHVLAAALAGGSNV